MDAESEQIFPKSPIRTAEFLQSLGGSAKRIDRAGVNLQPAAGNWFILFKNQLIP